MDCKIEVLSIEDIINIELEEGNVLEITLTEEKKIDEVVFKDQTSIVYGMPFKKTISVNREDEEEPYSYVDSNGFSYKSIWCKELKNSISIEEAEKILGGKYKIIN